jgi:Histidine kinase-, DNA gyrase B-, and HSP90-like ATPase
MNDKAHIPPNSLRLVEALRSIGYSFEGAVADLIDNSIAAGARNVLVRLVRGEEEVQAVRIVDDGAGMKAARLEEAMRFGADTAQLPDSLSKFGMGMKIASLSQARSLTVASRSQGESSALRWTVEGIADDWSCERPPASDAAALLDDRYEGVKTKRSGTVVSWEQLDRIRMAKGGMDATVTRLVDRLRRHLGLYLHRFLENGLKVRIDVWHAGTQEQAVSREIEPLDPFGYDPGSARHPERAFSAELPGVGMLELAAHIWPPNETSRNYKLDDAAKRQGLYFYRNDRLIQAGGWNGLRADAEPHLSLARVRVDLPPAYDSNFALDVQKASIKVPPQFVEAVEKAQDAEGQPFRQYLKEAQTAYRRKERQAPNYYPLVPGPGVASGAQQKIREALAPDSGRVRKVSFEWADLEGGDFFQLDPERKCILMNRQYRKRILYGRPATATDAPLEKLLLFLLFREDLDRERSNEKHRERLDQINKALVAAMKKLDD